MNAVDMVQEIVEIIVDLGAAKSVWPMRKKGVARTVRLAVASGWTIRVEGDARLEFVRDGEMCNMKFLDADVKRPLASVSDNVDQGIIVVFRTEGIVHREHEHWSEDSTEQEERRVCGAIGRTSKVRERREQ